MNRDDEAVTGRRSPIAVWLMATRPKTLAAGIAPVAVGAALAHAVPIAFSWPHVVGCLVGALLIQLGVNFANDAFDARKGADAPGRLGPTRAVASGLISVRAMLIATAVVLTLALGVGLWLAERGGWPILVLGVVSLICAVAYTGGPFPLAYRGLGDLFVLLFFGFFAVLGTAWIQVKTVATTLFATGIPLTFEKGMTLSDRWFLHLPPEWWLIAAGVGLQATAILCINNLRDLTTDAAAGKRTLAVRLGDKTTRLYHASLHLAAAACWAGAAALWRPHLYAAAAVALVGGWLVARGVARAQGAALNAWLGRAAALELATAIIAVMGLTRAG